MKKIFAVIMAVAMIASVFVFTANAAENEWEVYASVGSYKDEYEKESKMPAVPGLRYTEAGVQVYTASTEQLEAMGTNAWCGLQLKEKVNLKNGFTMTAVIDKYTDNTATDKWIAFVIWTDPKGTPGDTDYGTGWFCLARPNPTNVTCQSFVDTPVNLKTAPNLETNIYEQEALVLDVRNEVGKLNIYVNDQPMNATGFDKNFENNEAYISIVGHQGNRDEIAITITDVNGVKPTGTESQAPFIPTDIEIPVEGPEVEPGQPCWIWNSESVEDGNPGQSMTSITNDDGSLHITFDDKNAPLLSKSTGKYLYKAEDFPIFAVMFKDLDDIGNGSGSLWYCAGDVYAAQNDSQTGLNWADCDYAEEDGWRILTIDLSGETTWEGNIHGFRLDIAPDTSLADETADIMWVAFFRTEKDAYTYAGLGDYYTKTYEKPEETEPETEAKTDAPQTDAPQTDAPQTDAPQTDASNPGTTDKAPETSGNTSSGGANTGMIIGIVIAAVVAVAAIVAAIVLKKKKK